MSKYPDAPARMASMARSGSSCMVRVHVELNGIADRSRLRPVGSIYFMLKWRIATSRSHRHEECSATYACNEDLWLTWIRTTFRSRT